MILIDINHMIIQNGQHYDYPLSEIIFKEFKLSTPIMSALFFIYSY